VNILPEVIVTNNRKKISEESNKFFRLNRVTIIELPFNPNPVDYHRIDVMKFDLYTLHGFLRLLPTSYLIGKDNRIFNGHPGLITKYPQLKGQNPQQKAFELGMIEVGSVIHEVTSIVDDGDVLIESRDRIINFLDLNEYYDRLKNTSLTTWKTFFQQHS
jgi:folate-dependent phosphoribosylglycinamide formyltransferase PurN